MAKKTFKSLRYTEFKVMENGRTIGTLRVKPTAVLWASKQERTWYAVTIEKFGAFAKKRGKTQKW